MDRSGDFIQSLERGLAVINSFSNDRPSQTLSEVAQVTGLTRATARRVLITLAELGYVQQSNRNFTLTPKVLDLGYSFLSSFRVIDLAQPVMERMVEDIHESSSMSILENDEVLYVARVPTKRIMTISLALGSRLPAYPTSMGRVLLAALDDKEIAAYLDRVPIRRLTRHTITDRQRLLGVLDKVREQGYALVDQELEEGVRSVAVPVSNNRGTVIASMNVSCHASRVTVSRMRQEFLPRLREAAVETSAAVASLPLR